jgi:hypothetical protein
MKDFKKMPKMACGGGVKKYQAGGIATMADMYVPEKPMAEMYAPEKPMAEMYVPEKMPRKKVIKPAPEEFNLHKTVKQAAGQGGLKTGGKVKRGNKKK